MGRAGEGDHELAFYHPERSRVAMSSAPSAMWFENVCVDDVIANGLIRTRIRISRCAIDQWDGGVFEMMLRRIQGRPRWSGCWARGQHRRKNCELL